MTLLQVETIEVVSHSTVVEGLCRHRTSQTTRVAVIRCHRIGVGVQIITIDNLQTLVRCFIRRIAEDTADAGIHGRCRRHCPAILHEAFTRIGNTCRGERALDTSVIDITAEFSEQRVVETRDIVSVAVEVTFEALHVIAKAVLLTCYRVPSASMLQITMQDYIKAFAASYAAVHRHVAIQRIIRVVRVIIRQDDFITIFIQLIFPFFICSIGRIHITQIDEVLQQVETVLIVLAIVFDIDLRGAVHVLMVYVVVVLLGIHHLLQVVVVSDRELHGIRVGLAQIGLCIVGHPVAVLIPVHLGIIVEVGLSVDMQFCVFLIGIHLPSGTGDFEGTYLSRRQ